MTSLQDPSSNQSAALQITFIVITCYFSVMVICSFIAYGAKTYLTSNVYNLLNFAITIFEIITLIIDSDHFVGKIITSLRVLEFIYFGSVIYIFKL